MTGDPNADRPDELDGRLRAAGERFRAATTAPAHVDLRAAVDAPTRRRRARATPMLLAAAAVVLVAGVVVAVARLAGHGGSGHGAAGTPATTRALSLAGTYWTLSRFVDARGTSSAPVVAAYLRIDVGRGGPTLDANDGCNALGGPVTVGRDTLRFGNLISTAMGCLNPDLGPQTSAIHAVIRAGTTGYAIDGTLLTLSRGGTRLVYTASILPSSTPADPQALPLRRWQLQGVQRAAGGTVSSETPDGSYVLMFDSGGGFQLTGPCGDMLGNYAVNGSSVQFSRQRFVKRPCSSPQDEQATAVQSLFSRATWSLDTTAGVVTLRGGDTTLVFRG